jgi:hypothetical protein
MSTQIKSNDSKSATQWKSINEIVFITLDYLKKYYPTSVKKFLNWYEKEEGKPILLNDKTFQNWIIQGIPLVKNIINGINQQVNSINKQIDTILTSNTSVSDKTKVVAPYQRNLHNLEELITLFLGCQKELGDWFLGWLRYLATLQVKAAESNLEYFQKVCLANQQSLLTTPS